MTRRRGNSTILNIKDFGAKVDGTTDDIAAINAANAASREGDTILFPPGRGGAFCRVSAPIDILERRRYASTWPGHTWPYRFTTAVAFSDGSRTGGIVTLTGLSSSHDIAVGDIIQVAAADSSYNGQHLVTARTSTTVTYSMFAGDDASSGIGNIFPSAACGIKATSGFSGSGIFRARERTLSSRSKHCDGWILDGLWIDAGAASGTVRNVYVEGLCRSFTIRNVTGAAAKTAAAFDFAQGGGSEPPRGARLISCTAWGADEEGFRLDNVTDAELTDLLGVSCGGSGFYGTGLWESLVNGGRMVFNGATGWHFDGGSSSGADSMGQLTVMGIGTDRNEESGVLYECTGLAVVQFIAPRLRRDGAADSATDAGFKALNATAHCDIIAGVTTVGVEDDGTGAETPQNGIRVTDSGPIVLHGGHYWGRTAGLSESGTVDVRPGDNTRYFTGNRAGKATEALRPKHHVGTGTPESNVTAPIGSTYHRRDGGAGTSFYVKESGTGNTGWVGK